MAVRVLELSGSWSTAVKVRYKLSAAVAFFFFFIFISGSSSDAISPVPPLRCGTASLVTGCAAPYQPSRRSPTPPQAVLQHSNSIFD